MSHTSGEWQLGIAGNCNVVSFDGDDVVGVARCEEHNARLIAACPLMAEYVILKAKEGDENAKKIANTAGLEIA